MRVVRFACAGCGAVIDDPTVATLERHVACMEGSPMVEPIRSIPTLHPALAAVEHLAWLALGAASRALAPVVDWFDLAARLAQTERRLRGVEQQRDEHQRNAKWYADRTEAQARLVLQRGREVASLTARVEALTARLVDTFCDALPTDAGDDEHQRIDAPCCAFCGGPTTGGEDVCDSAPCLEQWHTLPELGRA